MSAIAIPARCQGCGREGKYAMGSASKRPAWCRCKGTPGILSPPPGVVVSFTFESAEDAAFRERCRVAGQAERNARDELCQRWVRCGKAWRELPRGNPKRERLERAYTTALRALRKCQRECAHPSPSIFSSDHCSVCFADLPARRAS